MQQIKILLFLIVPLLFLTSCESQKTIVNGLDQSEANEILVFLATKNINAVKIANAGGQGGGTKKTTYDIAVPSEKASEAMALLNQVGLPRRPSQSLLDIFSSQNLVPSEIQEQIRYQAGLASQIASTIRKIDGVLDAEVQISFPKEDPLNPNQKKDKITASVYVKYAGMLEDPNVHLTSKIKRLVSASVTGLDYDNVTVILDRARFGEASGSSTVGGEEKTFVKIWSVIVAQESLSRFRVLFFSFSLLILLLLLSLLWVGWKFYPVLKNHGGFKELLRLHPIHEEKPPEAASSEIQEEKTKEKNDEPGDREIDE